MAKRAWWRLRPHAEIAAKIRIQLDKLKASPPSEWTPEALHSLDNLNRVYQLVREHEVSTLRRIQRLAAILIPIGVLCAAVAPSRRTAVTIEGSSSYVQFRPTGQGAGFSTDFPVERLQITFNGRVEISDVLTGAKVVPAREAKSLKVMSAEPACKVTLDGLDWPAGSIVQATALQGRSGVRIRASAPLEIGAALSGVCELLIDEITHKVKSSSGRIAIRSSVPLTDLQFSRPNGAAPYAFSRVRADAVHFMTTEGERPVSGLIDARITFDELPDRIESIRERAVLSIVPSTHLSLDHVTLMPNEITFRLNGDVAKLRGGDDGTRQLMPTILDHMRDGLRMAILVIYAGILLWRRDFGSMKEFT